MTTTPTIWQQTRRANTTDAGAGGDDQHESKFVQLANGDYLVLWTSDTDTGAGAQPGTDIIAQRYDSEGRKLGAEFLANKGGSGIDENRFEVAARPNGGFVVIYESSDVGLGGASAGLGVTIWDADLATSAFRQIAEDVHTHSFGSPIVSALGNGSFLVGYQEAGIGDGTSAIKRHLISKDFAVGAPVTVVSGPDFAGPAQLESAHLLNNSTVLVGRHDTADKAISLRVVNAAGGFATPVKFVAGTDSNGDVDEEPAVAALSGGGFVVAWANTDANDTDIEFQLYSAAGNTVGLVGTAGSNGLDDDNRAPAVVGLKTGGFFLVWDNNELNSIEGQRYNGAGGKVGAEVTIDGPGVAQTTSDPNLALLQDGRIAVSWTNLRTNGGASDRDVDFAIYDPRETSLSYGNAGQALTARPGSTTINAGGGNDTVLGQGGNDVLDGELGDDLMFGRNGADTMSGGGGKDELRGGLGADSLSGLGGNDALAGEAGKDTLNGGAGVDAFIFMTALGTSAEADVIQDFNVGDDQIFLDDAIFAGLAKGTLAASAFSIGPAKDANDRIIYGSNAGGLFFDADGNGAGAAVKFATLDSGLALSNTHFLIV